MSQMPSPDQVKESKIEATDRLRKENRWNEASLFKDQAIKRLRAEGRTKSDASEAAWNEMMAKFPPLPAPPTATGVLDLSDADDAILDRMAAEPVDWQADLLWVYRNFRHPRPKLESAPSLAAWGLLDFARSEPAKFFGQLLPPVLSPQNGKSTGDEPQPSADPGLADLQRMIAANSPSPTQGS